MVFSVFVLPPSIQELRDRLSCRGSDNQQEIEIRLKTAEAEIERKDQFDYVLPSKGKMTITKGSGIITLIVPNSPMVERKD